MSTKSSFISLIMSLFLVLSIGLAFGQQSELSSTTTKRIIQLQTPTLQSTPLGLAKVSATTNANGRITEQKFQVVGIRLIGGAIYTLVVDGNIIDSEESTKNTSCTVEFTYASPRFSAEDKLKSIPKVIRPVTNIKHIEILDVQGKVVLTGDFQ